jgi:3-methyladenine DNA glycosylase Tag
MYKHGQAQPASLADYLEAMSRAIFSAGLSWKVVEAKWEGTLAAFGGFDPETVAAYSRHDIERLMRDPGVIHNRRKIEAIVRNAAELIVTDREFSGFGAYLSSFADNDELIKDLHRRFEFLGPSVAHFFLFFISFNLAAQEKWAHAHFEGGRHPGRSR